jgi:Tol biopolymer transport system component
MVAGSRLVDEPDWTKVPARLQRLLRLCLERDSPRRLRDISSFEFLVDSEALSAPSRSRLGMGWIAAGVLAVVAGAVSFIHFRETPPEAPLLRYTIEAPEKTSFLVDSAISPDGRHVAFSAGGKLWVRALDSLAAQPLNGTEGGVQPFWSPDGKSLGFFSGGKLRRIDIAGGPLLALADYDVDSSGGFGGTWSSDGVIVFAPALNGALLKIPASGGTATPATRLDSAAHETAHYYPRFLPDGKHFLFIAFSGTRSTIRVGSLDSPEIRTLAEADSSPVYAQGHLLFRRSGTLMAQGFDTKRLMLTGDAVPVAEQVNGTPFGLGSFSASANGILVYSSGAGAPVSQLAWLDRAGKRIGELGEPFIMGTRLEFSPDRKKLAVNVINDPASRNGDIWIFDVAHGLRTRFTFDPAINSDAIWSPDGNTIVFSSNRNATWGIYRKRADGAGAEQLLYADARPKYPMSWSPDGKVLLYLTNNDPKTATDLWILPDPFGPPGASKPYTWLQTPFTESEGQFSPDGKWIAYQSNESGRFEVYAAPFPGPGGKH